MAESANKFRKGINQDIHPGDQLPETYRNALNITPLSLDGDIYSVSNEDGTLLFDGVTFPPGKQVIGHYTLNNDIIVVLAGEDGTSQIGYIRESQTDLDPDYGFYRPVAPFDPAYDPLTQQRLAFPENNTEFGFSIDHPVDLEARKLINGNRVLYYTDNFNPFGRIELESPPEVGNVRDQSQLVFNQGIPTITFKEMREDVAGDLRPGVYQFVTRYVTNNGGVTTFGIPTDLISVVPTSKDVGVDEYHGEYYDTTTVNKNIVLELSDIDQNYQEIEVIAAYYENGLVFDARSVARLPITSDTITYTFTGPNTGEEEGITREELNQVPISYKRAKAVSQKDNTLFLSNLSDDALDDQALQEVANNITVEYQINEVPYSGREGTAISPSDAVGFSATSILQQGADQVLVTFNQDVLLDSFTVGVSNDPLTTADYGGLDQTLTKNGEPAIGLVDHAATAISDTVELDGITFTCVAIGAIADRTIEFEFDPDPEVMALNLAIAVNTDDSRNFSGTVKDPGTGLQTLFVWKGLGGNAEVITYSGTITGDAALGGESATVTVYNAQAITKPASNQLLYDFSGLGIVQLSEVDEINSIDIRNATDDTSTSPSGAIVLGTVEDADGITDATGTGFTDHLDEKVAYDTRSYRRGEVYSLGFMLLFKDGTTSFVYHIPGATDAGYTSGKNYPSVGNYSSGNTSGDVGSYISELTYPLDQYYPGDDSGDDNATQGPVGLERNIRHHVMPTVIQEPHFRNTGGGGALIRTLGLKFTLNPSFDLPAELKEQVQSIIFVRERRSTEANKSMLAQGIVNRLVETADHCNNDGSISGSSIDNVRTSYCLQEMPFFNNLEYVTVDGESEGKASGHSYRGVCYPGATASENTFSGVKSFDDGKKLDTQIRNNRGFFHSPESILSVDTGINVDSIKQATIKPVLLMEGQATTTSVEECQYKGSRGRDYCSLYGYHDMHGTYYDYDQSFTIDPADARLISDAADRKPGVRRNAAISADTDIPNNTTTRWTQGGWEIFIKKANPATPYDPTDPYANTEHHFPDAGGEKFYLDHTVRNWDKSVISSILTKNEAEDGYVRKVSDDSTIWSGVSVDIKNYLYSIELEQVQQYGQLAIASFMPIGRFDLLTVGQTYEDVFSGDTYITKFSLNTGGLFWYYPYDRNGDSAINKPSSTISREERGYLHTVSGPETNSPYLAEGYDFRACHYFFVESDVNTYYRHRPAAETRQSYFPDQPDPKTNLSNFFAWAGNIKAYNGLYSYENTLKEFFVKGSTQQVVSDFENRTIYSESAQTDSVIDSYRSFLVNNYYDLPSHTGPIWDTFVHANTLYMHTPKSCWRTFAEPAATISGGNISDVVLGTGPLFARPSTEVLTTDGGYGGSISQFGGTNTQFGYMFPDVLQGKVFLLGANDKGFPILKDLSLEGLYTFFHSNMDIDILRDPVTGLVNMELVSTLNAYQIDNPYSGLGFLGGYDYKLRRAWLFKQNLDYTFALSYSGLMQSWSSFHSYNPSLVIPFDNRVFFIRNKDEAGVPLDPPDMWEMSKGEKGEYFGTVYDSELEMSVPTGKEAVFNNQAFALDITTPAGVKVRDDFFDTMQVYTDKLNSSVLNFVSGNAFAPTKTDGEIFYKFRNDEYRVAVPRDAVVDNAGDIFDLDNIYSPQGGNVAIDNEYAIRERIKGDYSIYKYTYDNTTQNSFVLREIRTIFEQNIR